MIYKLNKKTGEITEVSAEAARRALHGWFSGVAVDSMFFSAKILTTAAFAYCRLASRLEELREDYALAARGQG